MSLSQSTEALRQQWLQEVTSAAERVYPHVYRTPLLHAFSDPASGSTRLFFKLESEQITGSFKARGAVNKLASLTAEQRNKGVVTASTGNHARATAYALSCVPGYGEVKARIFLPRSVAPTKLAALQRTGVPLAIVDSDDCVASETAASRHALETGAVFISPYNDPEIVGGQGTAGLEVLAQLQDMNRRYEARYGQGSVGMRPLVVIVPVGGGGLIAGVATAVKAAGVQGSRPQGSVVVVGVQPETNACMWESIRRGHLLGETETDPSTGQPTWINGDTLADGTAGGVEEGSDTWHAFAGAASDASGLARAVGTAKAAVLRASASLGLSSPTKPRPAGPLVDVVLPVPEGAIARAVAWMFNTHGKVVEGAAGCAVAAVLDPHLSALWSGCDLVAVCCGGNISNEKLQHCLHIAAQQEA